jgi:glycosyltransferase involved in cell wall biosynthesis/peptidoglycan/xylan/chitin deacetylase (PgdA/CDA1 family)
VTPVRVLHLIWALDLGGAERQVIEIVRGLDRNQFEPTVGCLVRKGRWGEALEAEGVPVVGFSKGPGLDPAFLLRLTRFIRKGGFGVVHTHAFTASSWGRLAAMIARVPVVVAHEHSAFSLESRLRRCVDRMLSPGTSRWIVVSEALARDLVRAEALPVSRVVVIPNGVPTRSATAEAVRKVREELKGGRFNELIGTLGRLERRKGLEVLLEAARRLAPRRPGLGVSLIGEGPLRGDLEERVRAGGIGDRVVFAGRREDVPAVLGALDVFAVPSHTEGLSISLLEAAYAGCPIVATDVGGNPEVVRHGHNGLLVPPRDPSALAEAIEELLTDRPRARRLGAEAAREARERFSAETMVRAIESVYRDLLGRSGSATTSFKRPPRALSLRRAIRRAAAVVTPAPKPPPGPALRVLAYHRVNDRHPGDRLSVHPLEFRRQMEHLAECGRPVLPLQEAVLRLKGEGPPLPPGALCLTFDDGYRDNLESAAPVLERLGFPATVFLVTGRIGARHTIDRYQGCCEHDTALTWDEAADLRRRGHALGGHGRSHRELGALEVAAAREEIFGCRDDLRAALGEAPTEFCYPRGSETSAVREAVAEAGFDVAVTVYPGANGRDADPLRLHRTEVSGHDALADFRWKLDGVFDGWHRLQQRVRPRGARRADSTPR